MSGDCAPPEVSRLAEAFKSGEHCTMIGNYCTGAVGKVRPFSLRTVVEEGAMEMMDLE